MKKIEAVISPSRLDEVIAALVAIDSVGLTMIEVRGRAGRPPTTTRYRGTVVSTIDLVPHVKLELVVPDFKSNQVVEAIRRAGRAGQHDEGRIAVLPMDEALRIRTGESGEDAV